LLEAEPAHRDLMVAAEQEDIELLFLTELKLF
jgi:hypothetical protein